MIRTSEASGRQRLSASEASVRQRRQGRELRLHQWRHQRQHQCQCQCQSCPRRRQGHKHRSDLQKRPCLVKQAPAVAYCKGTVQELSDTASRTFEHMYFHHAPCQSAASVCFIQCTAFSICTRHTAHVPHIPATSMLQLLKADKDTGRLRHTTDTCPFAATAMPEPVPWCPGSRAAFQGHGDRGSMGPWDVRPWAQERHGSSSL